MDDWNNEHSTLFRCEVAWKENGTRHETRRACSYLSRFRRRSEQTRAAESKDHRRSSAEARGGSAGHSGGQRGEFPTKHLQRGRPYNIYCARGPPAVLAPPPRKFSSVLVYPPIKKWDLGMIPGRTTYPGGMCLPVPDRDPHRKSAHRWRSGHSSVFVLTTRHAAGVWACVTTIDNVAQIFASSVSALIIIPWPYYCT